MKVWSIFGLFFMILCAALTACGNDSQVSSTNSHAIGSGASSNANLVHVVLSDTKITSDVTTFQKGVSYHFIVTNQGTAPYDLTITKVLPATATEQQRDAVALKDVNQLPPGQAQEFDFVFATAAPAGTLEFEDAAHYAQGMHQGITVV